MKRMKALVMAVSVLLVASAPGVWAGVTLVADALPADILANVGADAFSVSGNGNKEEVAVISSMPCVAAGVQVELPPGYLDLKAGAGMLLNSRFRSTLFYGDARLLLEMQRSFMIGPHAGLIYFNDPKWWGDADITFRKELGYMFGINAMMGDKIAYLLSVDYVAAKFDITEVGAGWTASDPNMLNMSGIAVQFGVRAQF